MEKISCTERERNEKVFRRVKEERERNILDIKKEGLIGLVSFCVETVYETHD
jgi:hypothetical protein